MYVQMSTLVAVCRRRKNNFPFVAGSRQFESKWNKRQEIEYERVIEKQKK